MLSSRIMPATVVLQVEKLNRRFSLGCDGQNKKISSRPLGNCLPLSLWVHWKVNGSVALLYKWSWRSQDLWVLLIQEKYVMKNGRLLPNFSNRSVGCSVGHIQGICYIPIVSNKKGWNSEWIQLLGRILGIQCPFGLAISEPVQEMSTKTRKHKRFLDWVRIWLTNLGSSHAQQFAGWQMRRWQSAHLFSLVSAMLNFQ